MMTSSSKNMRLNEIPPFSSSYPTWMFIVSPVSHLLLVLNSSLNFLIYCFVGARWSYLLVFFVFSSSTYKVVFKVPRPVPTSPELMLHWQSDARQQVFLKIAAWCPYLEEIKLGEDCHRISRFDTTEMSKILEDVLVLQLMLTELTWVIWITGVKRMVGVTGVTVTGVTRRVGGDMGWHGFIPCNVTKCAKYSS